MAKERLTDRELEELTEKVLATLTPIEKQVLAMRFGIKAEKLDEEEIVREFEEMNQLIRNFTPR